MKTPTKLTHLCLLTAVLAVITPSAGRAAVLADVRNDFVANSTFPLTDTNTTGSWTYYGSDYSDPTNPLSRTALSWVGFSAGSHNAFYGTPSDPNNIPAVTAPTSAFLDGATPSSTQVAWHPGSTDADLEWVAGTGETGTLTLSGDFSRIGENAIHQPYDSTVGFVDFNIYVNGVSVFSALHVGTGPTATDPFSLTFNSIVGTKVDFVLAYASGQSNPYYDESLLSASISAPESVPEPSTWALAACGGMVLLVLSRRKLLDGRL